MTDTSTTPKVQFTLAQIQADMTSMSNQRFGKAIGVTLAASLTSDKVKDAAQVVLDVLKSDLYATLGEIVITEIDTRYSSKKCAVTLHKLGELAQSVLEVTKLITFQAGSLYPQSVSQPVSITPSLGIFEAARISAPEPEVAKSK